jgi:sorbitol/mannitol transport system permease protein
MNRRHYVSTTLVWLAAVVFFTPFLLMVVTSLKPDAQAADGPVPAFFTPTLDAYRQAFDRGLAPYVINSLTASCCAAILVLLLAVPAAYALSVRPIKRWRAALLFFLGTRMLPVVAALLPVYLSVKALGLLDNVWTLVVLYTAMNLPIAIWMLRSFLLEIRSSIIEAAFLDGAGMATAFRTVILPAMVPGLAATALICFIFSWNEFFLAVNLTAVRAGTAPVFLVGFISADGQSFARMCAAATLVSLPVVLAGWLTQKQLVRGLSLGVVQR